MPPYTVDGTVVSSTTIREALANGEPEKAAAMLSHPYSIETAVTHGKQLGRTLGFPTANQIFPAMRQIPKYGVYVVRLTSEGKTYKGVANVGLRPTVENSKTVNAETYLLDYKGDLYGKTVKTEFLRFLRPEMKFADTGELQKAVRRNIGEAEKYFEEENK